MRNFTILMTSCSPRKNGLIHCIKDNADGVSVRVLCTNCDPMELPSSKVCDQAFVVPRNDDPKYIDTLLAICASYGVDIILPRLSSELEVIAANRQKFTDLGVKVAVTPLAGLQIANDKAKLYSKYHDWMPKQMTAHTDDDVRMFAERYPKFCCKLPHSSGAAGFAIVDDVLCDKVTLFHAYGYKHYISTQHLCRIIETQKLDYLLQEFVEGYDYTISLLADHGKVTHMVGYVGYEMEFSCIMYGEIQYNDKAADMARKIVSDLGLDGNVGIDFILRPDGDVVLLEVNPRMNATLPFVAEAGCNMAYLNCKRLLGFPIISEGQKIKDGLKMRKHYVAEYFV